MDSDPDSIPLPLTTHYAPAQDPAVCPVSYYISFLADQPDLV